LPKAAGCGSPTTRKKRTTTDAVDGTTAVEKTADAMKVIATVIGAARSRLHQHLARRGGLKAPMIPEVLDVAPSRGPRRVVSLAIAAVAVRPPVVPAGLRRGIEQS
jgi:hypothetical protein